MSARKNYTTPVIAAAVYLTLAPLFTLPAAAREREVRLTVEKTIEMALAANRDIRISNQNLSGRRLSLMSARSEFDLKVYPGADAQASGADSETDRSLGAGVSFDKRFAAGTRVSVTPSVTGSDGGSDYAVGVALDQPLFRGAGAGWNLDRIHGAEYSLRSSERGDYLTRVNTVLAAVSAFYEVARQEELLRLNEELAERLKGHAMAARAKERVGYASPIDVYRAEIQLKNAEDAVAESAESYENAKDGLKTILAMPQDAGVAVDAPLGRETVRMEEARAVEIAMENRAELAQAKDDVEEAARVSAVAEHNIMPDLGLRLDYTRSGGGSDAVEDSRWMVRLVATSDLARSAEKLAFRQSLLGAESSRLRLEKVRDDIEKQVIAQLRSLEKADSLTRIREEQITQAEGKLELAKVKFNHGLADNFDVIEAEMELRRAMTNRLIAAINYIVGTYRLRAALGTLIGREG